MRILNDIPFDFDHDAFGRKIRLPSHPEYEESVDRLLNQALPRIRPKALYVISFVQGRTEESVDLGDVVFKSRALSARLKDIGRVFPYVATCGNELEQLESGFDDLLVQFWLDSLKEMALRAAVHYLQDHLRRDYGLEQISSMNPGSADANIWPIQQQKKLFALLGNVETHIGVRLTDSCLMIPNKSLSGIYYPTTIKFESCELCTRPHCPNRRAPYKGNNII